MSGENSFAERLAGTLGAEHANAQTTRDKPSLSEELKRLGFIRESHILLYGHKLTLVSDPIVMGHNLVVVDAIEENSAQRRRVSIPLTILNLARGNGKLA